MLPWLIGGAHRVVDAPAVGGRRAGKLLKGTHCMHPAALARVPPLPQNAVGMPVHPTRRSRPPTNAPYRAVNGLTKSALEAIRASMALEELLLEVGVPDPSPVPFSGRVFTRGPPTG